MTRVKISLGKGRKELCIYLVGDECNHTAEFCSHPDGRKYAKLEQSLLLPPEIALQSISRREIVLPLEAVIEAVDHFSRNRIHILGWEGWVQTPDGWIGHGNALQGTVGLADLSVSDAADFCRQTIRKAAVEWAQSFAETTDRLYFCLTVKAEIP